MTVNKLSVKQDNIQNNEPVAYIPFAWYCAWIGDSAEPVWEQYEECHPATKQWDNFPDKIIPLYTHPAKTCKHGVDDGACKECYQEATHPAKTLTDEEILDICIMGGFYDRISDPHFDDKTGAWSLDEDLIQFARAILRKASEK